MSVPPQIAAMMASKGPGGASPAPGAQPPGSPAGAPMTAPAAPDGQRQAAMAQIGNCLDLMEITLPKLGAETEEGQAVMDALRSLAKVFGKHRSQMQELQPAQMQMMLRGMPHPGGMMGGMPPRGPM